jgi:ABC-2 type transport system ATP-binding protein
MKIEIKDYCKTIKGVVILDHINLTLESGKSYGFQGKNGSGKTMLMRAICGLIKPTSGCVEIDGKRLGKDMSFPDSIGALIENPAFLGGYTGLQNLEMLASIQGKVGTEEIREVITQVGLDPDDTRKYRKYSLGMKQKLGIAAAFMEHPAIIVLDEPINAIDEKGVEQVKQMVANAKERGAIIIVACHDAEELNVLSDEIIRIEEGRICHEKDA